MAYTVRSGLTTGTLRAWACLLVGLLLCFWQSQQTKSQTNPHDERTDSATQAQGKIELHPRGDTPWVDVRLIPLPGTLTLRLPELISDMDRRLVYSETNLREVTWHRQANGTLTSSWRQAGLAAYQVQAVPEPDGLLLSWKITNLEGHPWNSSAGTVCMQSHGIASLYDQSAERTYLRHGGAWVAVSTAWSGPGGNWFLPPDKGLLGIMRPYVLDGSWKVNNFRPDEAIVALLSSDLKWVLAQAWHQARYFIANAHDHYACTDVCPDFGDIQPRQTVWVRGKIYFFRGGLDDLEAKYEADLRNKIIGAERQD